MINKSQHKSGSVYLLAVGLMSLLILLIFSISRYSGGRARLVSLADQKQTALYALEAFYGDMISQIRVRIRDKDEALINSFISATEGGTPGFSYVPGQTLSELFEEQQISIKSSEMFFEQVEPLKYPAMVTYPGDRPREKRGRLCITNEVTFLGRNYKLTVKVPFKTVFTLTPVLRQFAFFADRIHLEQREKQGLNDRINIIPIEKGSSISTSGGPPRLPLCLGMSIKPHDQINSDNEKEGYVYLGKSDQNIILNLAGEIQPGEGELSDLWQVNVEHFKPVETTGRSIEHASVNTLRGNIQNKTLSIPLRIRNTRANLRLVGFCRELADENGPWYKELRYVLESDPGFRKYDTSREALSLSSGIRILGASFEAGAIVARIPYPRNVRNVFGRVFNRFFVLSIFDFPSAYLNTKLRYTSEPSYLPPPGESSYGDKFNFEIESGSYRNYMSRTMSGNPAETGQDFDHQNAPANLAADNTPKVFTFSDFHGSDGVTLTEPLDRFAGQWFFDLHSAALKSDLERVESSVIGRITRVYRDQEEFKEEVGLADGKLWINGVVAVDGDLTLEDLPPETDIRGGIVLVNGKITLGNISRGLAPSSLPPVQMMLTRDYLDYLRSLKPEDILTFVSLSGDQIKLTDNVQIGVHLVSLKELEGPEQMLTYANPGKVLFAGALALSTPYLDRLTTEFRDELPLFSYPPEMATTKPPLATVIEDNLEGYDYVVE